MEQLRALSLARKLILGGGILLLIDSFLDWQHVSYSVAGFSASGGQSMWHGFWGVLIGLMTVALIAGMIALTFGVAPPQGVPQGLIALVLGGLIVLFAIIKVLADDYVHWPAYIGIVLGAVVAYGAWRNFQESGESLPSMPKAATTGGSAGGGTTPTQPAPPAESEPSPPPSEGGSTEPTQQT